jgi:hypothetical protein
VIAALFVDRLGCYAGLEGVDPWDARRDARLYRGPWPVVAHPPCGPWSKLAPVNRARYGHAVGDDGGCFAHALASVREFGGVLEHPASSRAWGEFGLPRPVFGAWTRELFADGIVCEVSQRAYGHSAEKLTWLYAVRARPVDVDWSRPPPVATISFLSNHRPTGLRRLGKREASATPTAFRDLLLAIARTAS